MVVVDASVAAKWLLPESGQVQAEALLHDPRPLVAPALLRLEVAGAITRRVRLGQMPVEEAKQRAQIWLRMLQDRVVSLVPDEELLEQAILLSLQLSHGLSDCLYLALAKQQGHPLITADEKLGKQANTIAIEVYLLPRSETH